MPGAATAAGAVITYLTGSTRLVGKDNRMKTKTKLGLGFGGQVLLAAILGIYVLLSLTDVKQQFSFVVERNAPVIANAKHLSKLVLDMETGQRGFCIVQKEEFLAPYISGAKEFEALIEEEKELVSDNPGQIETLERIEHLVQEWQNKAAMPEIAMASKVATSIIDAQILQDTLRKGVGKELINRFMALGHEIEVSFSGRGDWEGAFVVELIEKCMADREGSQRGFLITGKEEFLERYAAGEQRTLPENFARLRAIVSERGRGDELSEKINQLEQLTHVWNKEAAEPEIAARREMNEHPASLKDVAALLEAGTGKALMDEIRQEFDRFIEIEEALAAESYNRASETTVATRNVAITLLVLALCLGIAVAVMISRAVSSPLLKLAQGAERVGRGHLDTRVEVGSSDEIGDLARTFNTMTVKLMEASSMHRQAEEALRKSEEKYRRIFENMQDAYYESSLDGTILEVSPSIENVSQYKRKELIGKSLHDIYTNPKERDGFLKLVLDKGKANDLEISLRDKDGSEHPCSITTSLVKDERGNPIKFIGSMRDISKRKQIEDERKKLEGKLQQAQKMEAMGTLAGGVAHDFNNLLMAIQGRTSIMLTKKDSSHPDIRHLKGIEDNIESAADLTRQLLGFARGGKYEVKPTDLNELVKKENRMFGRTKKQISIREKYEKDLWSVEVDQGQISQVLLNLYVNAWQAMPAGGGLHIKTQNVTLDENYKKPYQVESGSYVQISVTDTGPGMDKATQKRIFEPFFTTKEMGKGTGLGLASAYGIIKNHGGFISVYSEKGHGSTFNICLPASEKEAIEERKSVGDTLKGSETVLFVDDEPMIIEVAGEMIEQLGYKVLIAKNGKEAIDIYEENEDHIDIVLLDMIMPNMNGSDTYDRMKAIDPDIKVLLSSGYSINGQATEIMDRGCSGFIQKPFKMKELSQKLREILDEK